MREPKKEGVGVEFCMPGVIAPKDPMDICRITFELGRNSSTDFCILVANFPSVQYWRISARVRARAGDQHGNKMR